MLSEISPGQQDLKAKSPAINNHLKFTTVKYLSLQPEKLNNILKEQRISKLHIL